MLYTISLKAENLDEQNFNRIMDVLKTLNPETALPERNQLQAGVNSSLPSKDEIIAEAQKIYKELNSSSDFEAIRQAKTAQLMFLAGAWFSRGFPRQ